MPNNADNNVQDSRQVFKQALINTTSEIAALGSKVILFSQAPDLGINPRDCWAVPDYVISDQWIEQRCEPVSYEQKIDRLAFTDQVIASLRSPRIMPVILKDVLCNDEKRECQSRLNEQFIYFDQQHLNALGSEYVINAIEKELLDFTKQ